MRSGRVLAGTVLLALLGVTGCNTVVGGTGTLSGVPEGGPSPLPTLSPPATDSGPPASTSGPGQPTPTGGPGEPGPSSEPGQTPPPAAIFELGETGTVTDESGLPLADITVADARKTPQPPDEFSDPPANGAFLSVTVTIENLGDTPFTVAPFDFMVLYPDGTRVAYGEGSTGVFGYDNLLDLDELGPGETATGLVVFDVDPAVAGTQIVYSDLSGRVLGAWNVP